MTVFELAVKISVDSKNVEKGIKDAESNTKKLGQTMSKISSGVAKAGKVIGKAVGAASIALGKLALDAVKSYGEYEQQVGGIKKLFGDNWKDVVKDAQQAFKTAGVDANTYMQNVTSFSASLIKSLKDNTAEAARLSNRAMRDMADNANTFGTSIDSIQAAYQGFAKQNYTMLDNLKLGYGGTATEMKKLIRDAAQMKDVQKELGITVDASSMSFDNIIKAISVMQKHLNIAGTTAAEAGQTFQGSFTMMKASWENLKIAMVDPEGNVNEAIQNLVDSTKTFAENAFPLFNNALKGIATAVKQLAPQIGATLPQLVVDLLPDLATAAIGLINGIMEGITSNIDAINDVAVFVILSLVQYLIDNIPNLLKAGVSIITGLVNGIASALPKLIPAAVRAVLQIVSSLTDNASKMADAAVALIEGLAEGIVEALPILIKEAPKIIIKFVKKLIEEAPRLVQAGLDAIKSIVEGLAQGLPSLTEIWESAKKTATEIWNALKESLSKIWESIKKSASDIWNAIKGYWTENIQEPLSQIWDGIKARLSAIWEAVKLAASTAWEGIKSTAVLIWNAIKDAVTKPIEAVKATLSTIWDSIQSTATAAWNAVSNAITPVINGIKGVIQGVIDTVKSVIDWFGQLMGFNGQDLSETTSGHTHTNTTVNRVVTYTETVAGSKGGTIDVTHYDDGSSTAIHKNASGNKTGVSAGRGFAKGIWDVPYDMSAMIHRGEAVLTASQARRYREGEGGMDVRQVAEIVGSEVRKALKGVGIYMGADRVADLTANRMNNNIGLMNAAILHGMGG